MSHAGTKTCTKCGIEQPLASFGFRGAARVKRKSWCKECSKANNRQHYAKNLERSREYEKLKQRGYYSKNKEFDPQRYMLQHIRGRAGRDNIPCNLTKEDIVIPEFCPVLGIKLKRPGDGLAEDSPSVDRIDPSKGYVRGNIAVISMKANRFKNNATLAELEAIVYWLRMVS